MNFVILLFCAIIGYLIGSINTAIIVGKIAGNDDIRSHGSGNAGATNALRTYGKVAAVCVVLGDCLKSAVACILGIVISVVTPLGANNSQLALYASAIGVVLGHNFPLYFKFKGGKGILVSITALMFADWKIALPILIISIVIMTITKYVSLGSVLGSLMFIAAALIFKASYDIPYTIFTCFLAVLAIYRHRSNIKRLLNGTESKLGTKAK